MDLLFTLLLSLQVYWANGAYRDDVVSLRSGLLFGYNPYIRPDTTVAVSVGLTVQSISLDSYTETFTVTGKLTVKYIMNVCSHCGKEFKLKGSLRQHELRHSATAPYICCGKPYYSKSNLKRHRCNKHEESKCHVCNSCGKGFPTNADLQRHERRERGSLKITCDICGYKAESKDKMADHTSKHTGEKRHRCEICNRTYRYISGLSNHKASKHQA